MTYLCKQPPETGLLIIGDSVGDQHTNSLLRPAAKANTGPKIFTFDPTGLEPFAD